MASTKDTQVGASGPALATDAVLKPSVALDDAIEVSGVDFDKYSKDKPISAADLVAGMKNMGFQATNLGVACDIINEMRAWKAHIQIPARSKDYHFPRIYFQPHFVGSP